MKTSYLFLFVMFISCSSGEKEKIVSIIGEEEYSRLISLNMDLFDQSSEGFRQYSDNYELTTLLIPEYINVNKLSPEEARNLHWHMGQIHVFNGYEQEAITEMEQAYAGGSITWKCYVDGSIAFLKKDKPTLEKALKTLQQQENQMNIEILEKFVKYFDQSYIEAYSAPY